MRKLSGPEWFAKHYRRKDEGHYAALLRLVAESGLNLKTVYRAVVHQTRLNPESLALLEKVAGEGRLDREAMLSAPTEVERLTAKRAARAERAAAKANGDARHAGGAR